MPRNNFGWDFPPGCSLRDIDGDSVSPEDEERDKEDERADRQRDDDIDREIGI